MSELLSGGTSRVRVIKWAQALLKADDGWTGRQIAEALLIGLATVGRIRRRYVEGGLERALDDKKPDRVYPRKVDAHLIALVSKSPPESHKRWPLRLMAEHLVALEEVELESISYETVRQVLKKNELKPWRRKEWVIPPEANAEFVCGMEAILDLYQQSYNQREPVVCVDEKRK